MFPAGVIYESVSDQPMVFRGESGANDSIIPMADNLLEITKELVRYIVSITKTSLILFHQPKNALTETLREFREYRPSAQREYLFLLETRATELGLAEFAKEEVSSLKLYILMVDQVREFRDRHWKFTKEYIVRRSDYPIATGEYPLSN